MPGIDAIDPELMFVMMKGEAGTRKSTAALSFPGPQYWFSWDRKMSGILIPFRKWGLPKEHLTYDDYDDWTAPKKKLESLQVSCPYETLVFDSLTSMADMTLRQTVSLKYGKTRKSGSDAGKTVGGIAINEIEDYNAESAAIQEMISLAKDIQAYHYRNGNKKIKIILIAHVISAEYKTVGGATHTSRTIVTAGKKVAAKIPGYCTEVWHFNIEPSFTAGQGNYSLLTNHTGDDYARTSIDLPNKIVFGDDPLYKTYIQPALDKMRG